jgi:SPX domain protein involved in polyphosphate accumulation
MGMKCDEMKPLVFLINDLAYAYVDEPAVQKNFENPHDHAVYKATEVDEAIAELNAQKAQLEDGVAFWKSKYKECKRELDLLKDTNAFYNGEKK